MEKSTIKWFWVWQQQKEKAFLEEQALKGYLLKKVCLGMYLFEERSPKKRIFQIDFRNAFGKISESEYLQIFDDAGWVLATKSGGIYYFYQDWKEGIDLSLFNDQDSQRKVYLRLLAYLFLTGFPLYFFTLFILPQLSKSTFYLVMIILAPIILVIHLITVLKILSLYRKSKKSLRE